jgi:hypothetical protein
MNVNAQQDIRRKLSDQSTGSLNFMFPLKYLSPLSALSDRNGGRTFTNAAACFMNEVYYRQYAILEYMRMASFH